MSVTDGCLQRERGERTLGRGASVGSRAGREVRGESDARCVSDAERGRARELGLPS